MDHKWFIEEMNFEFNRILPVMNGRRRHEGTILNVEMNISESDNTLWLAFSSGDILQSLCIPIPYKNEFGNLVVGNEVVRPVGSWFLVESEEIDGKEVGFWELMKLILVDNIESFFGHLPGVGKRTQLVKILSSFEYNKAPIAIRNTQRIINDIVNKLPLSGTSMQDWAMNNRVIFIDPMFDSLPPADILEYQAKKNKKFFPWSSLGMSDSAMIENYMLKVDMKKYSPFCVAHHNPMRNLYQPLGMKGPEKALIQTTSMRELEERGISRGGWNWMTAFIDLPLNFEDQIIINSKHKEKVSASTQRFVAFGKVRVDAGDVLEKGDILSIEPNSKLMLFLTHADSAVVLDVRETEVSVNGNKTKAKVIEVGLKRTFKEGFKFTNLHGNKGIAVFRDLGTVYDPIRKKNVDIDIIVAAKTIGNRKNFGQIFEALSTMLNGPDTYMTIADDYVADVEKVKKALVARGCPENGAFDIDSLGGKFKAVCGWMFWGLLREPEDSVWERSDVVRTNQLGSRPSGSKVSHIELRALTTLFGPSSSIVKEILTHREGNDVVREYLRVLQSMTKKPSLIAKVVDWKNIKPIAQTNGFLHKQEDFTGTISDVSLSQNGFFIKLPFVYETTTSKNPIDEPHEAGRPLGYTPSNDENIHYMTDTVYVPFFEIRAPWQHQSGLWGISDVAGSINNIVEACKNYEDGALIQDCARAVYNYFHLISSRLSTKKGLLATYCMAVRYPHSIKGTASCSDRLPANTIEVHSSMAKSLGVSHNDFVLVERFPCLGFLSMRPQRVWVTEDEECRYVIRVSGGSLNSLALDYDGDVLFLLSCKTPEAKAELEFEFRFPNSVCQTYIQAATDKKKPRTWQATLDDFVGFTLKNSPGPMRFRPLTPETQSEIARSLIGIKVATGSVIALNYNISRITEGCIGYDNTVVNAGMEVIMDKTGNSVFGGKHRVTYLLERFGEKVPQEEALC
jgi:hypothetical protein